MNVAWAKSFEGDVKIVYYNDLIENLEPRLREIVNFIKYPIDEVSLWIYQMFNFKKYYLFQITGIICLCTSKT